MDKQFKFSTRCMITVLSAILLVGPTTTAGATVKQASRQRTEAYSTPFLGHPDVFGMCQDDKGCTRFGVGTKERFVSLEVADASGTPVYAYVSQLDSRGRAIMTEMICGSTSAPIAIEPSRELQVALSPVTGAANPCPGIATHGEVTAIFTRK